MCDGEDVFGAVGIGLAQRFRPLAVGGDGELACGVALDVARRFGKLQPEDRLAGRAARRVERMRLSHADRRRLRQHAARGLVAGFRDAVEAGRQVQQRDLAERGIAPGRRAVERVVDLEIALAVAVFLRRRDIASSGAVLAEQALVELRRRDRADDALRRRDRLARGKAHAGRAAALDDRPRRRRRRCGSRRPFP